MKKLHLLIFVLALSWASSVFGAQIFVKAVDDIDALKLASVSERVIVVLGSASAGDGLGGTYYWSPSSASAGDDISVVVSSRTANGRWLRFSEAAGGSLSDGDKGDVTITGGVWSLDTALEAASPSSLSGLLWASGGANRTAVSSGIGVTGSFLEDLGTGSMSAYKGFVDLTEVSTPANPDAGVGRIYANTDGALWYLKSDGSEIDLTSGAGGADADAIHDNVSGEISALTDKATPVAADHLLIEDSAASDAKKDITIASLETALEGFLDLENLQGAVIDSQVPNNITIDLATLATTATTADTGDSATAFFPSGTIEDARLPSSMADKTFTGTTTIGTLAGAVDAGGATSFEIPNAAAPTVSAFGQIAGDNDLWAASRGAPVFFDGTAAVALIGALVSDVPTDGQVPKWNTGGTITWEPDDNSGAATAFNDIGDATASGVIALAGFTNQITSTLDGGNVISIYNTDADNASDTVLIDLAFDDEADANSIFLRARYDIDGTPTTIFQIDSLNGAQFGTGNGQIEIGSAGVRVTSDGDGALTFLGLGDGSDEDLTLNFDDTANTIAVSSSTSVSSITFGAIGLSTDTLTLTGTGTLNGLDAIDGTGEATLEAALDIAGEVTSTGMSTTVIADNVTVTGWTMGASSGTTPSAGDNDTSLATSAFVQGEVDGTKTGTHTTPSTSNPLAPTWSGPMHTVYYGATGEIDLPAASTYNERVICIYNTGAFTITIDPNGSEVIVRDGTVQTGGVTFTLSSGAGNYVFLLCDGTRWITLGFKGTLAVGS